MNKQDLTTIANHQVDLLPRETQLEVATYGFKGSLVGLDGQHLSLSEDDACDLRCAIQDVCKAIEAGAVRAS